MGLKRDELSDPNSTLNRAADDEPLFILRANDECAAAIIGAWALAYSRQKRGTGARQMSEAQQAKARSALQIADAMRAWKLAQTPDASVPELTTPDPVADAERFAGKPVEHIGPEHSPGSVMNCPACWQERKREQLGK